MAKKRTKVGRSQKQTCSIENEYKKRIVTMLNGISDKEYLCKIYTLTLVLFKQMEAANERKD